jgi:hypothetical protein
MRLLSQFTVSIDPQAFEFPVARKNFQSQGKMSVTQPGGGPSLLE